MKELNITIKDGQILIQNQKWVPTDIQSDEFIVPTMEELAIIGPAFKKASEKALNQQIAKLEEAKKLFLISEPFNDLEGLKFSMASGPSEMIVNQNMSKVLDRYTDLSHTYNEFGCASFVGLEPSKHEELKKLEIQIISALQLQELVKMRNNQTTM